jgi:4-amino-4-deoxy-L-arabinose transferase-like glycosyltransferase
VNAIRIRRTWRAGVLAAALAAAFLAQVHFGSLQKSLTWDEPVYIAAGYTYLEWGFFHLNPSHPPLLQYLAAFPLIFLEPTVPAEHPALDPTNKANLIVPFAKEFIFHSGNDVSSIAYWGRLSRHILGTLLVLGVFLWGRHLYGDGPALLATAVTAFSPNLIAHSKLATEDLGCTTLMFFSVWAFWHCIHSQRLGPWILCGLVTGLALASKYTALLLGPIYVLLMLVTWQRGAAERSVLRDGSNLGIMGLAAVLVVGAMYDFSFDYTHYIRGLGEIYQDKRPNYSFYLFGEAYQESKWYYFVVAALMKIPLPILLLMGAAAIAAIRDREHREAQLFLLIPVAFVLIASFMDAANLGLRRILPAFPFLFLFTAQFLTADHTRVRATVASVLVVLTIFAAIRIYPHHLAYFNELAGGPERGPYLLDDSNLDWGQDLPALAAWQRAHPEATPLKLSYHGLADPASYGVSALPFVPGDALNPTPGYYAISAHNLAGLRKARQLTGRDIDWLEQYEPADRAGYSIYIYRMSQGSEHETR